MRVSPAVALLAAAGSLLAAGCAEERRPDAGVRSSPPATSAPAPARPSGSAPAADAPLTLAFAGDVHFTGRTRALLDRDPDTAVGPMSAVLGAADLAMVNLETAVTERGTPQPKTYTFRAPATAFAGLRSAGIDITTMANNHGLDFGPVGLADSLAAIRATGFPTLGIGPDEAAVYAPYRVTVRGTRIAFLAGSQVIDASLRRKWIATDDQPGIASAIEPDRLLAAVRAARASADVVVVYLHWGQERNPCPISAQRSLAAKLVDAGADVLVGTHAHTLVGAGYLGSAYVSYGLGNFLWYTSNSARADTTGVLTLTLDGRRVTAARWSPARISGGGAPEPVTGAAADRARERWASLRSCTDLTAAPR